MFWCFILYCTYILFLPTYLPVLSSDDLRTARAGNAENVETVMGFMLPLHFLSLWNKNQEDDLNTGDCGDSEGRLNCS